MINTRAPDGAKKIWPHIAFIFNQYIWKWMVGRVEEQETNIFRESHTRSPIAAVASKNNSQHWKQVVAGKLGGEKITALWRYRKWWYYFEDASTDIFFSTTLIFSSSLVEICSKIPGISRQWLCLLFLWTDRRLLRILAETGCNHGGNRNHPAIQFSWNGVGQDCLTWWFGCKMWAFSENGRRSCWISIKIWIVLFWKRERWSNFI